MMQQILPINRDYSELVQQIKAWASELGFVSTRITHAHLPEAAEQHLTGWLAQGFHGEMDYMQRHGLMRVRPQELVPGALSVISVKMPYWPKNSQRPRAVLQDAEAAYISRYALGRDYHKVVRHRLQKLAERLSDAANAAGCRVFCDSAPIAEAALAAQAGAGWQGKHTLLIDKDQGSLFFLGELVTDLPLPVDAKQSNHCGRCSRCMDVCPTQAIVAPYSVDARRCISYLTIELKTIIPEPFRKLIGNRIYGCDDCQLVCPWNRFAVTAKEMDFSIRHGLDNISLVELFHWTEEEFKTRMAGSAIYRIGYAKWLSNIAIALGNAPYSETNLQALSRHIHSVEPIVQEAVQWALGQQNRRRSAE